MAIGLENLGGKIVSNSSNFDEWTEWPGSLLPIDTHKIIQHRYRLAAALAVDKDVLEVGCGSGAGLAFIASQARKTIGLEYNEENISRLRAAEYLNFRLVRGDAVKLPFAAHSFDLVVALAMIYYLNLDDFLENAQYVLKPKGVLFFCTSNKDVPGFVAAPYTTRYYSVPELNNILSDHGFSAEFLGAFPSSDSPLLVRVCYGVLKELAKRVFQMFPVGRRYWESLRIKKLGGLAPLPVDMNAQDLSDINLTPLSPDKKDYRHRVIYIKAHLK